MKGPPCDLRRPISRIWRRTEGVTDSHEKPAATSYAIAVITPSSSPGVRSTYPAERPSVHRLDDERAEPKHRAFAPPEQLVPPHLLVSDAGDDKSLGRAPIGHGEERDVVVCGFAKRVRLRFARPRAGHVLDCDDPAAHVLHRHLVAESAVEPRDASDALDQLATLRAPLVDGLELCAHQAAQPVVGVGSHQLDAADGELDALVGPGLRDQVHRGRDGPGAAILDYREVLGAEPGKVALHQVARPVPDTLVGGLGANVHRGEVGQRLGVLDPAAAQHQAVSELPYDGALLRRSSWSVVCRRGHPVLRAVNHAELYRPRAGHAASDPEPKSLAREGRRSQRKNGLVLIRSAHGRAFARRGI